jgi:hypothetical protein
MEVTVIILSKSLDFACCRVPVTGFLLCKSIGPSLLISLTHKITSYDTNMLLKVVSDKTAFVKFKIGNNFKQNIDETDSKHPKIHRKIHTSSSLWILKIKIKIRKPKKSLKTFAKYL